MSLLDLFRKNKKQSASLAKERLKIIVEHSRADAKRPDFLKKMNAEILEVVSKYVNIGIGDINTNINHEGESEVLEVNVILPEKYQ